MKIIAEFEIPHDAEPIQATLDYYIPEGNKKGLCCVEIFQNELINQKEGGRWSS